MSDYLKKNEDSRLRPIGYVRSSFLTLEECPFQGDHNCPPARINIDPAFAEGLEDLKPDQEIIIITLLHKASRQTLKCRPKNDPEKPLRGVFSTRSPNRPNPLGLHQARIISMDTGMLLVHPLEVLDGTPVVDIKPVLKPQEDSHELYRHFSPGDVNALINTSRLACVKGLLNGLNGNLSIRKEKTVLITRSGSAKGLLSIDDLCVMDLDSGRVISGSGEPSSESGMHREIYRNQPEAGAVAHTHPISILTLDGFIGNFILEGMDLFEAESVSSQLVSVPDHAPGTLELAKAVGSEARNGKCILMRAHGLTCWGTSLPEAICLSDELEALARIQLGRLLLKPQAGKILL